MSDILDDLEWLAQSVKDSGGGEYREYNVAMAAITEIKRLRSLSGVVSEGKSALDIMQEIRRGASV